MNRNFMLRAIIWFLEGAVVGFGAIMPGINGGALCVAFGMYQPLIGILSDPKENIRKHWKMICVFVIGGGAGFIGLSGLAAWLMARNSQAVTCAFVGFILGTLPELWKDAGKEGRKYPSIVAMLGGFGAMLGLLILLKGSAAFVIQANIWGFFLCGILWGLSFVVPGLSSSTLLLFFGLYQPMLDGIARLSPGVILPLAAGAFLCLLILSKAVNAAFQKYNSVISHCILGIVVATTVMIVPSFPEDGREVLLYIACIVGGSIASYFLSTVCGKLKSAE